MLFNPGKLRTLFCLFCFYLIQVPVYSQKNILKGIVTDSIEKKALHFSIVALINVTDSTLYKAVRTNEKGEFEINKIPEGNYTLMISYPGLADYLENITITNASKIDLKTIFMIPESVLLQEVIVRSGAAIRMRGDTLEYTADSFAVRPGSNVEELLKDCPE